MRDIDLTTLRLFVAVCNHGNISRVAESANIVGSAISKRLSQLEHATGTVLLKRVQKGMVPTAAGEALLEHARMLLAQADNMERELLGFSSPANEVVRIFAATTAIAESLPAHVAAFVMQSGQRRVQVNIEEHDSNQIVRQVRAGAAEFGVCWDIVDLQGLDHAPFSSDEVCLISSAGHPLNKGSKQIQFKDAVTHPFVGMPFTNSFQVLLRRSTCAVNLNLQYSMTVPTFDALSRAVSVGAGLGLMPLEVAKRCDPILNLKVVRLTDVWAKRRFLVCRRRDTESSETLRRLWQHLTDSRP